MKRYLLAIVTVLTFSRAVLAGGPCGDPQRVAALLHGAIFAEDRAVAESRLIAASFPVTTCLAREGYTLGAAGVPGHFSIILDILSALRRTPVRMSAPEDVDRQLRLWKVKIGQLRG